MIPVYALPVKILRNTGAALRSFAKLSELLPIPPRGAKQLFSGQTGKSHFHESAFTVVCYTSDLQFDISGKSIHLVKPRGIPAGIILDLFLSGDYVHMQIEVGVAEDIGSDAFPPCRGNKSFSEIRTIQMPPHLQCAAHGFLLRL